jgi:gliding motility-associated-like protein
LLSHQIVGLNFSDTLSIQVVALGACGGEIGVVSCFTPACPAPTASILNQTDAGCFGANDGTVEVQAAGGSGSYTYSLNGQTNTTGIFSNLPAGTYALQAWEDPACPVILNVSIGQPAAIALQEVFKNNVSCTGNADASATLKVSGGTFPYGFAWSNGQSDSIATNLPSGTHTVQVTDANGCMDSLTVYITEPPDLDLQTTAQNVTCFGLKNGEATVTPTGGTMPYLYQWDAQAGNQTSPSAQDLLAGTYAVVVTDVNGCQETATVIVDQPPALMTSTNSTPASCANGGDGLASVSAVGGTGGFNYFWSNGDLQATADSLSTTTYFVTVSDANSCTTVDSVIVGSPPAIDALLSVTDAACNGENSGSISAQASGGAGGFSYNWSNGGQSANVSSLPTGNYCLTITDASGCTATTCANIDEPEVLDINAVQENPACHGGSDGFIDLTLSGGTGPFQFNWSNGSTTEDISGLVAGTYNVTVTDANGCTKTIMQTLSENLAIVVQETHNNVACKSGSNGTINLTVDGGAGNFTYSWLGPNGFSSNLQNLLNLSAGTYAVSVTDANQCTTTAIVTVQEPATSVTPVITSTSLICYGANNGSASVSTTGGVAPYTYTWSNGQTGTNATNLTADTYTVTATDASGCTATSQVQISEQAPLSLSLTQTDASCQNGSDGTASVQMIQVGGNNVPLSGYSVQWSASGQTTPHALGLTGGQSYTVTITDNTIGCTATAGIIIGNPTPVLFSLQHTKDVSCANGKDGEATVSASGGSLPYQYQWSMNANGQTGATATQLPADTYTVTITDSKGCTSTGDVAIGQPAPLVVQIESRPVNCFGGSDGSATMKPQGGVPPYSVLWSSGQTGVNITELAAGTYTLTLSDAKGCTMINQANIGQPPQPLTATAVPKDISCQGLKDGSVKINATGGTAPYRYSLDGTNFNGSTNQIALAAGTYEVYVKDKNDCIFEAGEVFIDSPEALQVDLGPDTLVVYGSTIWIEPKISNYPPEELTYQWTSNNPQTPPLHPDSSVTAFEAYSPATVKVIVSNANGCTANDLLNIFVREIRNIQVPTGFSPNGDGVNDLLLVHGTSFMVEKIKLFRVFDRWGELIYELRDFNINDPVVGWDGSFKGENMPPGVYVWYLEVDFVDGSSDIFRGHTTLIR